MSRVVVGGLKIPVIASLCSALKISRLKTAIDLNNHSAWKSLLIDHLQNLGGDKILFLYKGYSKIMPNLMTFGKIYFQTGLNYNKLTPQSHKTLLQPLWCNPVIKIRNNMIFYQTW